MTEVRKIENSNKLNLQYKFWEYELSSSLDFFHKKKKVA